jgi:hypothetical protein
MNRLPFACLALLSLLAVAGVVALAGALHVVGAIKSGLGMSSRGSEGGARGSARLIRSITWKDHTKRAHAA